MAESYGWRMMMTFITVPKGEKAEGIKTRRVKLRKAKAEAVKGCNVFCFFLEYKPKSDRERAH